MRGARRLPWALLGVLALAVLFRLVPLFGRTLWYDDAVEGMMSQDVLRGRFPFFFYGQPYHGAADRYLAALVFLPLGSTPLAIALAPLALFLVFVTSLWYTTREIFGERVALVAALYLAVPPFYLYGWGFDPRAHYHLMLIFGAVTLLLGWRIWREGVATSPRRRVVALGFLAGVGWWTNYLGITVLAPVAFLLLVAGATELERRWRPLLPRAALALGAFAVGATPLFAYYLPRGLPLVPPGQPVDWAQSRVQLAALVTQGLPQILGVHRQALGPGYGVAYLLVGAFVLGATAFAVSASIVRGADGRGVAVALLLGVAGITVALSVLTGHGAILRYPRYLLPLYLVLPVFVGLAAERLGARLGWAGAAAFLAPLLLANLVGSVAMMRLGDTRVAERERAWAVRQTEQFAFLDRHRVTRVYDGPNLWTFLSDRRILASDPRDERMPEVAREVDAAERVGWIFKRPSRAFEGSLAAAGIAFRRLDGPRFVVYTEFALPSTAYVELEPIGWSASASDRPEDAGLAHDRNVTTAWHSGRPQRPGMYYQLDLGRPHSIGRLTWLPRNFREVPRGISVTVSTDGREWREVVRVDDYVVGPLYWSGAHPFNRPRRGRVELRFAPVPARHVRLSLTAGDPELAWSLRELLVGTPAGECPRDRDPAALVRLLLGRGIRFAYADHWLSARIDRLSGERIGVLASDTNFDAYGLDRPDPDTIERLKLTAGRALVLDACPAQTADAAAALVREAGVAFDRDAVAGFAVLSGFRPATPGARPARWRLDGGPDGPLLVTLDRPALAARLALECREPMAAAPADAQLEVEASGDGRAFVGTPAHVLARGKLRMSGSWLFRDAPTGLVIEMPPRRVQALRVTRRAGAPPWCALAAVAIGEA